MRTIKTCSIDGCDLLTGMPGTARGFCNKHYTRYRRHGDPNTRKSIINADLKEHFDAYATHRPEEGCWIWQGYYSPFGYGIMHRAGKTVIASRTAYELFVGPLAPGEIVRHTCDNPPCCNPKHLLSGTHQDNSDDKWSRGRANIPQGARHGQSKLTSAEVALIRDILSQGVYTASFLARCFKVSSTTIYAIRTYKTWAGELAA